MSERYANVAVYMMASRPLGVLYVGVTNNLPRRVYEHREGLADGFTRTYGCKMLVWYESNELMTAAIQREKAIKHWPRVWKPNLVEQMNPEWADLYPTLSQ